MIVELHTTTIQVLAYIIEHCRKYAGNGPTLEGIARACNIGKTTASHHVGKLCDLGVLARHDHSLMVIGAIWTPPADVLTLIGQPVGDRGDPNRCRCVMPSDSPVCTCGMGDGSEIELHAQECELVQDELAHRYEKG